MPFIIGALDGDKLDIRDSAITTLIAFSQQCECLLSSRLDDLVLIFFFFSGPRCRNKRSSSDHFPVAR